MTATRPEPFAGGGSGARSGTRPARLLRRVAAGDLPGLAAVVATYAFFLLWAQFGFLELIGRRLGAGASVRPALAAMGLAGIAASAGAGWLAGRVPARRLVAAGLAACTAAAPLALACAGPAALAAAAAATGAATALLTVALAAGLRELVRGPRFGLAVGAATGVAYWICNLPPLFEAAPGAQAAAVAALCAGALALLLAADGRGRATADVVGAAARRPARDGLGPHGLGPHGLGPDRLEPDGTPGGPAPIPPPVLPAALYGPLALAGVVLAFLVLVWLDSAAFAVIQRTAALKGLTWGTAGQKLTQGSVHLVAAVAAGAWLDRRRLMALPAAAWGLFAAAFTLLGATGGAAAAPAATTATAAALGAVLYAAGISIYSVALVVYPAAHGDAPGLVPRRWRAALLFGVAGWLGSALGVGMAEDLGRVPRAFVGVAGLALAAAALAVHRGWAVRLGRTYGGAALVAALAIGPVVGSGPGLGAGSSPGFGESARPPQEPGAAERTVAVPGGSSAGVAISGAATAPPDLVARGRRVYVAEGCIHCHSQYVRPATRDAELWGPARPLDRGQRPPLVGTRRQGPDLLNVGNRRSAAWQRLHLADPRALVPESRMPSYAHLFAGDGRRGESLVAYLGSLGAGTGDERWRVIEAASVPAAAGSPERGARLFARYCAPCHGEGGRGDGPLAAAVRRPAMDLGKGRYWLISWGPGAESEERALARLIRFGVPGTSMPGHEWLDDRQVADLVAQVQLVAHGAGAAGGGAG